MSLFLMFFYLIFWLTVLFIFFLRTGLTTKQHHEMESEVGDMKELLQSWYRSFAYISRLQRDLSSQSH